VEVDKLNLVNDIQAHQSSVLVESADRTQEQVLSFLLDPSLVASLAQPLRWGIEIAHVKELVNILIDRVVPMPQLPPAVMGVYNWRGEILWIVDLAMLLGAAGSARRSHHLLPTLIISDPTSVIDGAANTIGLVIEEIADIEWCELDPSCAAIANQIQPELARWLRGVWRSDRCENFLGLDRQAIFDRIATPQTDRI
jgi:positive phototaxis protein PixI